MYEPFIMAYIRSFRSLLLLLFPLVGKEASYMFCREGVPKTPPKRTQAPPTKHPQHQMANARPQSRGKTQLPAK